MIWDFMGHLNTTAAPGQSRELGSTNAELGDLDLMVVEWG